MSSVRPDWNTPSIVLSKVRAIDQIVLDPCSNSNSIVGAQYTYDGSSLAMDGLIQTWQLGGLVYVNPPYGQDIVAWTSKCAAEASQGVEIVSLVPARTDTKWWHTDIVGSDNVLFWSGRLKFLGAASSAPFPSAVVYWGERSKRFKKAFEGCGWFVK